MIRKPNLRISAALGIPALLFSLLVGCAAKKPFWGDVEAGLILRYQLKPNQTWTFHASTKHNSTMEMMGQSMDTESNSTSQYTVKGIGQDDQKNLLTEITVDTMSYISQSPRGEHKHNLSPLIGKSFGLTLSPLGEEIEFSNTDSLYVDLGMPGGGRRNIETFFRNPFPNLPPNPVKIGNTWTIQDEDTVPQSGLEIAVNTEGINTLERLETVDGIECLKIQSHIVATLDGAGQQMGAEVAFEGDLEGTTTWYFAYKKGVYVKLTSDTFMEGTAVVSGQTTMTIPMTQEAKTEIKLVP